MSTTISADMVKTLREKTGAGMMDVRNALAEAGGDMEKATEILRQKGIASADKKGGRTTSEGLVNAKVSADGKSGVLVEINSETDFVARNENFVAMVNTLTDFTMDSSAQDIDALLKETIGSGTVDDFVRENIGVIKENLTFRRFARLSVNGAGQVNTYIHTGGKIGVLLVLGAASDAAVGTDAFKQLAKDLTLHIASAAPEFVQTSDIPGNVIEDEKRIEMGKEDLANKPEEMRAKIVEGRVQKLLAQRVLLEQPFVKDPSKTIAALLKDVSAQAGSDVSVQSFARFVLGEGVEPGTED
jgi:elongation factor Ts